MANLNFFAAEHDQKAVIDFLFTLSDLRVFESYSDFDRDLQEFRSFEDLSSVFPMGIDRFGNGTAVSLQLYSPSIMKELTITRFGVNPDYCEGHTFRHRIDGGGLMQLYLGGVHEKVITKSHFGHFSLAGAKKWGLDTGVDWDALKTISGRIQHHIRKRLAVAKVAGRPVLPQAFDLAHTGYELKETAQTLKYELS